MTWPETKNAVIRFFYKYILKRALFFFDPEKVHDFIVDFGAFLGKYELTRKLTSWVFEYRDRSLEQDVWGVRFKNPVGLAAGFDKNARLVRVLPGVGFGFAEIGSVTGERCAGNPGPRLWRLIKSKSLVVYYGLKNDGCEIIAERLNKISSTIPVGINMAKTNSRDTADTAGGISDYAKAYRHLCGTGGFHVLNISCPNAFGGEPFTDPGSLRELLSEIEKLRVAAPLLLKLSPDLNNDQVDSILDIAHRFGINGVICSNLTKKPDSSKILDKRVPSVGGLSGKALENAADRQISHIYKKTNGQMTIIGCGGIFSAEDAYKKIRLGASLVELITGMIFEGPQLISDINIGLAKLLRRDGFNNISEAIGADNRF